MSDPAPDEIAVELDAPELGVPARVGTIRRTASGLVGFDYQPDWIERATAFVLDPAHGRYPGPQFPPTGEMAGILTDLAPDRWGRRLLERRERHDAQRSSRRVRALRDWDFLLGVADTTRMGALRLLDADGRRVASDGEGVPPQTRLRELESAARGLEEDRDEDGSAERLWLLLAPGSSLGGARPKSNFRDPDEGAVDRQVPVTRRPT